VRISVHSTYPCCETDNYWMGYMSWRPQQQHTFPTLWMPLDVIYWKHKLNGAGNEHTKNTATIRYKNMTC